MTTGIDFTYLLIENYKKLKITENELATIFCINYLIEQGNDIITADLLSLKMSLDVKEIDKILASLFKKKYLSLETNGNKTFTSLDPLKNVLYDELEHKLTKQKREKTSKEYKEELSSIIKEYESKLNKKLSPVEKDKIEEWINFGYTKNNIIDALKDALNSNKKTIRSIEKILLTYQIREDMDNEGHSVISESWNKNLEETIKIAKTPWIDDDNK